MTAVITSLARSALRDLEEMQVRHAEQGTPEVGFQVAAELLECIKALAEQPVAGRVVPEFGESFLREQIHPPFRIIYHFAPHRVRVVRVWNSPGS